MGPFGHPLFTSLTGIGIGIAVTARRPVVRVVAVLGGWVCAMLLHGLWNFSALAGMDGFFEAYVTYQVPLFLAFIGFLFWLRRREGRLIGRYLSPYADAGWLTHAEVAMLSHLRLRRAARAWARQNGGRPAKRSMDAFQDSASDLALLRSRLVHGTAEDGASRARDGAARGDHGAPPRLRRLARDLSGRRGRGCLSLDGARIGRPAPVAQRIEQEPSNLLVAGSSPAGGAVGEAVPPISRMVRGPAKRVCRERPCEQARFGFVTSV